MECKGIIKEADSILGVGSGAFSKWSGLSCMNK